MQCISETIKKNKNQMSSLLFIIFSDILNWYSKPFHSSCCY